MLCFAHSEYVCRRMAYFEANLWGARCLSPILENRTRTQREREREKDVSSSAEQQEKLELKRAAARGSNFHWCEDAALGLWLLFGHWCAI